MPALMSLSRAIARHRIWRLGCGHRVDPMIRLHEHVCEISSTTLMSPSNVGCGPLEIGCNFRLRHEMNVYLSHAVFPIQLTRHLDQVPRYMVNSWMGCCSISCISTPTGHEGVTQWTESNTYASNHLHKLYRYHHQLLAMEYVVLMITKLLKTGAIAVFIKTLLVFHQMKLKIMKFWGKCYKDLKTT
jgi:hypothetical protein